MAVFANFVAILPSSAVIDFLSRCSLSAGRAVSILGVNACGVSPVPLLPQESRNPFQSTLNSFRFKSNNLLEKSLFYLLFSFKVVRLLKNVNNTSEAYQKCY
jgi:hypothetical protein